MTRAKWNGRTIAAARHYLITHHGRTCWLCGHTIQHTVSIDHVLPVSTHPQLEHTPTNWRPAHLHAATSISTDRCTHPGCHCPGNTGRKAAAWTNPPSRTW